MRRRKERERDLGHGGVLPDAELVLGEAVGRDELLGVAGPEGG